jgi:3-hydroxyisobutyrate dehydrogenase
VERVCVFGLGEAGSAIASDLIGAKVVVHGFDPARVPTPDGVERFDHPADAVQGVDMVFAITAAADAPRALEQALADIPGAVHYADFATSDPRQKLMLATMAARARIMFTDVALMGTVPGRGLRTPVVVSGRDAESLATRLRAVGMDVTVVGSEPGVAATHKLVRSVFVKGLAAVLTEAMSAAAAAGMSDDTWRTIVHQVEEADEAFLERLMDGTSRHARRRHDEMDAAVRLLHDLGVPATMTTATVASLEREIDARRDEREGSDDHER